MAGTSDFLKMIIPLSGEYTDTWHVPMNDNLVILDSFAQSISVEMMGARGNSASLGGFLGVAHNTDGTLKPTEEVEKSRNSPVYGHKAESAFHKLYNRADYGDWEVWRGREGEASLRDALAAREAHDSYMIISGGADSDGQPTWGGFTNDTVQVNASPEIKMLINGYRARIRVPDPGTPVVTVSVDVGAATPKFLVAERLPEGKVIIDGDTTDGAPPAGATGQISNDVSGEATIFYDANVDFVASGVWPGDKLTIVDGEAMGEYIVAEVGPEEYDGDPEQANRLKIIGLFPVGGLSALDYKVRDMLGVDLEAVATEPDGEANKFVIADILMETGPIRIGSIYPRQSKNVYVGAWRQVVDIAADDIDPDSEASGMWFHRLLSDTLEVEIQASQADDGSAPVEKLAVLEFKNTLTIDVTNTQAISNTLGVDSTALAIDHSSLVISNAAVATANASGPDVHAHTMASNPAITGSSDVTGAVSLTGTVALTGDVTAAPAGDVYPANAVKVQWDRRKIRVKNTISGVFYTDFDDAVQTSGYIRVIVRKRG